MNNKEQAYKLIEMICDEYKITKQDLNNRKSSYAKRTNKKNYISISSIRQALGYFIYTNFYLTITEVAKMVGYSSHHPLSCQRKTIEYYIKAKDFKFYPYYEKVVQSSGDLGINNEYSIKWR
jgi:hypothetical protein